MTTLDELTRLLKKLPGMGSKSATRIAYYLIKSEKDYNAALANAIAEIKDKIHPCPICGAFTEGDECEYCSSMNRDKALLCIVEEPQDVLTISSSGAYNGLFHVLGGAINPLNGIGPDKLSFRSLKDRVEKGSFKEIIIATNPTEEGDTTALYIKRLFEGKDITITRLASGLPIGGDLGYADKLTLLRSMRGRVKLT